MPVPFHLLYQRLTCPPIDSINFKKLLGAPVATIKGNLDQERKNLQSTKVSPLKSTKINTPQKTTSQSLKLVEILQSDHDNIFPPQESQKTYNCINIIIQLPMEKTYTDQTGRFLYQSSRGQNYVMVSYDYDVNSILVHPLKNREVSALTEAWNILHKRLKSLGHVVKHYILDNEFSGGLCQAILDADLTFELVPPHQHRRNAAERAVRTFKNHFIAGLATCHPDFLLQEWDRLLMQAELTLNLLRTSHVNPKLSAWAYLFGQHDFNKMPLLPPGTKVVIHSKPDQHKIWAYHGEDGWYVGPAPEHYRCLKVYIPKTHKERITDTATIVPHHIPIPKANIEDHIQSAANDLVHIIHAQPNLLPAFKSPTTEQSLIEIANILNRDTTPTIPSIHDDKTIKHANLSTAKIQSSSEQPTVITNTTLISSSEGVPSNPVNEGLPVDASTSEGESHVSINNIYQLKYNQYISHLLLQFQNILVYTLLQLRLSHHHNKNQFLLHLLLIKILLLYHQKLMTLIAS